MSKENIELIGMVVGMGVSVGMTILTHKHMRKMAQMADERARNHNETILEMQRQMARNSRTLFGRRLFG